MSKILTYSERFKIISENEACFEEAFVLLFEAIDEILGKGMNVLPIGKDIKESQPEFNILTTGGTA